MRISLTILFLLMVGMSRSQTDTIFKVDGSKIICTITFVNDDNIFYDQKRPKDRYISIKLVSEFSVNGKRTVIPMKNSMLSAEGSKTNSIAPQGNTKDYSLIYLVRAQPSFSRPNTICNIFVANQSPFNLPSGEIIVFKVFSEGEISIGAQYSGIGNLYSTLKVKTGNDYYVYLDGNYFSSVPKETVSSQLKETEISEVREENPDSPINPYSFKRKGGQGTCFLVSADGFFITNFHCVENTKEITVKGINGDFTTKYPVSIFASDPTNDLALLKINNKDIKFNAPAFGLRTTGVAQAEKIYCLGYPSASLMGEEIKITEGIISAKSGVKGDISKFQISAAVNSGNSGGPLIDDNGNLVGIVYAKSTIAELAGYAVKAGYLEIFLKNVDGFAYPVFVNTIAKMSLPEKVNELKKSVFIVESK